MLVERPFAQFRRQAGLDLHRAAARLGISPRYLRQLETAQAPLSLRLGERMSIEYGISIQALATPYGAGGTGGGDGGERKRRRPLVRPSTSADACRTSDTEAGR
jgi:transcriptional regulator with XRE-family HTH domain